MNDFPQLWSKAAEAAALWGRLRAEPRSLLMLDYDGTLAPFHNDRFQAAPYPGVEDRLAALSQLPQTRVVLVTGRAARELRALLRSPHPFEIWGSHGREQLKSDGSYKLFALDSVQQATLQHAARKMAELGLPEILENKPSSIAVHWRSFEPAVQEQIRSRIQSVFAELAEPGNLDLLPFDGGLELRSTDRTKGTAVRQLLAEEPAMLPVAYLGDDLTDEDAFASVGRRGFSILVRDQIRGSCARFWLRPPQELLEFLDQWIAASQNQTSAAIASVEAPR